MMGMVSDNMKIGMMLVSLGFLFLFLGVMLLFDSGLLAIGNILLLVGFPFILGFRRTLTFFNPIERREKWRGIACFFGGIVLVLMRWAKIGMLLELVGMVEMFGSFLPIVLGFLRQLPVVGPAFSAPGVKQAVDFLAGMGGGKGRKPRSQV